MEMEARRQYLDVEAHLPLGSITGTQARVHHRWALMGTVVAFALMAVVAVGVGDTAGTTVSVKKPTRAFAKAFAPSVFASPGLRPMLGQGRKFAKIQAVGHGPKRPAGQRPAVQRQAGVRLAPLRMSVKDNQPGAEVELETKETETKGEHLDFAAMRVGALKKLLTEGGVSKKSIDGCFEKEQLLVLAEQNRELLEGPASAPGVAADTSEDTRDVAAGTSKDAPDTAAETSEDAPTDLDALKELLTEKGVPWSVETETPAQVSKDSPEDAPADLESLKDLLTEKGVPWSVETGTPSPVGADPVESDPAEVNPSVKAEVVDAEVMDAEVVEKAKPDTDTKSKSEVKGESLDFAEMRAGALKKLLTERGVSTQGLFDKDQLLERAEENREILEGRAPPAPDTSRVDPPPSATTSEDADVIDLDGLDTSPPGAGAAVADQEHPEPKGQWSNDDGWDPVARSEKFAKEKRENDSKVNFGEAVDSLNRDIPQILRSDMDSRRVRQMNWDIYTDELETKFIGLDPAIMAQVEAVSPGFSIDLKGLNENKQALQQLQGLLSNVVEDDLVTVTTKMSFDPNSGAEVIESRWRAKLTTKNLAAPEMFSQLGSLFGQTGPLTLPESVVDVSAVSRFRVNAAGKIYLHTIDQLDLLVDNKPIDVPQLGMLQNLLGGLSGRPQNGGPQYGGPQPAY